MVGLVVGVVVAIVAVFLLDTRAELDHRWVESMQREARAAATAAAEVEATPAELDGLADRLGTALDARVTFIASGGEVLGDSEVGADRLAQLERHDTRPEVVAATRDGRGVARRLSNTVHVELLYAAEAFDHPSAGTIVARVARSSSFLDEDTRRFSGASALTALVAIFAAALLAGYVASALSRRLRSLATRAGLEVGADEVAWLAGSFDRLSERVQAHVKALEEARNRFSTVIESLGEAVVAVDERRQVTATNALAGRLFALGPDPVGQRLLDVAREPELVALLDAAMKGETARGEFDVIGVSDVLRRVSAVATPLRGVRGAVIVASDVTEMRHLETMRQDFVANVSHELRTPVSIIRGSAETLETMGDELTPTARRFTEKIVRTSERMGALISDLLDLSRIEEKALRVDAQAIELAPLVQRVLEQVRSREDGANIVVELDAAVVARGDERAIEQIVRNLLENALKYGHSEHPIRIEVAPVAGETEIAVSDRGPGIPADARGRVFERFYRVDAGRSRDMGGTGLGLAIVRRLAESMGGRVGVDPVEPHGCRFWLRLPRWV
jgi:two-component system phosphate regulon sensor histidine kinase PhoR